MYNQNTQHTLALVQGLLVQLLSNNELLMDDNARCELGLGLSVIESLQDPYQMIADHFGLSLHLEKIHDYIEEINSDHMIWRISSDDIETIEDIIDIVRGSNFNWEYILCSTAFDIRDLRIDICSTNEISSYVITVPTDLYFREINK